MIRAALNGSYLVHRVSACEHVAEGGTRRAERHGRAKYTTAKEQRAPKKTCHTSECPQCRARHAGIDAGVAEK